MLYSDELVSQYPSYPSDNTDYYDIISGSDPNPEQKFTETMKVLLPAGLENILSINSGDIIRLRNGRSNDKWTYRTDIRGMITKMPGFSFSGYKTGVQLLGTPAAIVSDIQYKRMLDDFASVNQQALEYFYN